MIPFRPPLSTLRTLSFLAVVMITDRYQDPMKMVTKTRGTVAMTVVADWNFWTVAWTSNCSLLCWPSDKWSQI